MSPEQIALARHLTEHPAFKWTAGMCAMTACDHRWRLVADITGLFGDGEGHDSRMFGWEKTSHHSGAVPDLTDPATRGCLLDLARTAWDRPSLHAYLEPPYRNGFPDGPGWRVNIYDAKGALALFRASTEGEVLALAILESP